MNKGKVLFIDEPAERMEAELNKLGYTCEHKKVDYETLMSIAPNYCAYIIRSRFALDRPILDASVNLKFIGRIGAGMENIDVAYAESKGIHCINSPEGNADAVSEYVVGSIFCMLRNFHKMNDEVKNGIWHREKNRGFELNQKTVGILGYGHMGRATAKKLSGFGCKVIAYDKYRNNYGDEYAEEVDLQTLQQQSDILSIHINYIPENYHFINREFIEGFSKEIYLINTSRGKSLSTADLSEYLKNGKIKMVALDVLEYENIRLQIKEKSEWDEAMKYLASSDRVLLSPHVAGQTFESLEKHVDVIIEKLKKYNIKNESV